MKGLSMDAAKRVSWNVPKARHNHVKSSDLGERINYQRSQSEGDIALARQGWIRPTFNPSPRRERMAASHRPPIPACLDGVQAREQGSPRQAPQERAMTLLAGAMAS